MFISLIFWGITPLESIHLLWINLVTDGLPAIALGMTKVASDVMMQKPKKKDESIFANKLGLKIFLEGVVFAGVALVAFYIGKRTGNIVAGKTMTFMVLALSQVVHTYTIKNKKTVFTKETFDNKYLNLACLGSVILVLGIIFTPLVNLFGLCKLSNALYSIALLLVFLTVGIFEVVKALGRSDR